MSRSFLIAITAIFFISAEVDRAPAQAPNPIMALPPTYRTWNNKTRAYQDGAAITYSNFADAYANARNIQGVPNSIYSYIVTSGETTGNGHAPLRSTVGLPATPALPFRPLNLTVPAATPNTSLGGLIDAFAWGAADTVMNQCFAGGFAFNLQGSLQGARPVTGGAVVPAPRVVPYTFASGASFNELSFGTLLPTGNSAPAVATAGSDFTQGWSYASTNSAPVGMPPNTFTMYRSYANGRTADPFVIGGGGLYGVPLQVPTTGMPPAPHLQAGVFESPVYASPDAAGAAGAVNEAAANNARTLAVNAANRWAVLLAMTPDRPEFSLDIQRQYAALLSNGVPRSHIVVLYGAGTEASLARFTNLTAANNLPNVNNILNTVAADFRVPVHGATSLANISGLLNPTLIQNPAAPPAARVNFWQHLLGTGPGGAAPAAGNSLLLYVTGHGSGVNIFGGEITAINRAGGGVFTTDIKLAAPDNITITPGTNLNAQITARSPLIDVAADMFQVNGVPIGPAAIGMLGIDAFDVSQAVDDSLTGPYYYYNVSIPTDYLYAPGYDGRFTFSISSPDLLIELQSLESITLMDDVPTEAAKGEANMYVNLIVPIPEPGGALLVAWAVITASTWRRARSTRAEAS